MSYITEADRFREINKMVDEVAMAILNEPGLEDLKNTVLFKLGYASGLCGPIRKDTDNE